MSPHDLHDRRILVTGGTSGLGRALVGELVARGAHVAFVARHRARGRAHRERVSRHHWHHR